MGILVAVLAVALGACSDDPDKEPAASESSSQPGSGSTAPDAPLTEVTVDCPEYADVAQKIVDAQAALYEPNGADPQAAIDDLVAELDGLKEGAPDDVQTALTDLGEGFRDAAELLEKPTLANRAELVELAPKLSEDGQRVTEYITSQCG